MRGVSRELPDLFEGLVQSFQHLIERLSEPF
jgi:hypothetical protein